MSNEANDKGWLLHSLAQARRFGPMTEDELRGYFRAGMVKSVDRLTAPGDDVMRPAAEVAALLGETVPAGPPPPELEQRAPPTPVPSMAAGVIGESGEERAAKAAAAMNIDLAALMASSAPPRRRSGWLLPIVVFGVLVVALMMGLNMLRKLQAPTAASAAVGTTTLPASVDDDVVIGKPQDPAASDARHVPVPAPGEGGSAPDAPFEGHLARAQALHDTRNWTALAPFAKEWAQAQPERNEPLLYLGLAYSRLGDHRLAAEPLRTAYARDPDNTQVRSLLADVYLQGERWTEAAALYKQMVGVSPDDARLWNNYGAALNGSGQQVQAVAAMENAVRLDPTFKQAWTNLGNVYQSMGDSSRAAAAFTNAR